MAGKILVAGHICLDITPVFSARTPAPLGEVLVPGKLVQMRDVNISTGGAVANTGLALKILGADVVLMGKIGKDAFGEIVLERLRQYGARTRGGNDPFGGQRYLLLGGHRSSGNRPDLSP